MAFEHYINSGSKKMRCGFTTGTCAALASQAAVSKLLLDQWPESVQVMTPKGLLITASVEACEASKYMACCGVRKDAGDDIDCTANLLIMAKAERSEIAGICIDGGIGVGRVTKPGLDQPVGEAAINSTPRRMIEEAVRLVCEEAEYEGGIHITIYVPEGESAAKKTFNPNLGIIGGISILGTSGIVEPMSQQALIDTLKIEIHQKAVQGEKRLILTPGNYGLSFIEKEINAENISVVKCSNFIGDSLDQVVSDGFEEVLLIGHIGKMVKLAGGIMNTHSRYADCRMELFCAHAVKCGGSKELCEALLQCVTTDACIALLKEHGMDQVIMASLLSAMEGHLNRRIGTSCRMGLIVFSNEYGELGRTRSAEEILNRWK